MGAQPMIRLQTPLPDEYGLASEEQLSERVTRAKEQLAGPLVILGHHYQREEVISFADARGDSFGLSRFAAAQRDAEYVVFCGVHFMAESADILTGDGVKVLLPDLNAGCSMADMADLDGVEQIWEELGQVTDVERVVPITYMNSSAALKAFVGRKGGSVCTSSNARSVLRWALGLGDGSSSGRSGTSGTSRAPGDKVLFFPDQHLGRNTGFQLGFAADDMRVVDPRRPLGGLEERDVKEATFLLWQGHCSVHQRFSTSHVESFRAAHPDGIVIVHPECAHEVVELADQVGSTDYIIGAVAEAPPGSVIAVGTEIHLVDRLARAHAADRSVVSLDPLVCPCSTMFRIDLPHLAWVLDGLVAGEVRNRIVVDSATAADARVSLERMLAIA
ncbi:MAG: quinolinate synthase NadA [Actinomycetota bacterium]|nr:quinolinate synthase NadA [Actinomycetota bacterium]